MLKILNSHRHVQLAPALSPTVPKGASGSLLLCTMEEVDHRPDGPCYRAVTEIHGAATLSVYGATSK